MLKPLPRMVGAAGIEPATPTMSTYRTLGKALINKEIGETCGNAVFGIRSRFGRDSGTVGKPRSVHVNRRALSNLGRRADQNRKGDAP